MRIADEAETEFLSVSVQHPWGSAGQCKSIKGHLMQRFILASAQVGYVNLLLYITRNAVVDYFSPLSMFEMMYNLDAE